MKSARIIHCISACVATGFVQPALRAEVPTISWRQLPPLPDPCGFASPFVGAVGGDLIVAGGANFPERQLWEGGTKTWHDRIFVLQEGAAEWRMVGRLQSPLAYGLTIPVADGILCAGGGDRESHHRETFLLRWNDGRILREDLPSLPKPVAMGAGAEVDQIVYLAGGMETPTDFNRLSTFFAFDLRDSKAGWRSLPPCPGPARSQAVAASAGGYFYLFSGLARGADNTADRYLTDAYRYSPSTGWERLPDLPFAAAAAATPAPTTDHGAIFVVGGVDGTGVGTRPEDFILTPQRIQSYSPASQRWSDAGNAPVGRVCVNTVRLKQAWILPCGERSAGIRSPEVWSLRFSSDSRSRTER